MQAGDTLRGRHACITDGFIVYLVVWFTFATTLGRESEIRRGFMPKAQKVEFMQPMNSLE